MLITEIGGAIGTAISTYLSFCFLSPRLPTRVFTLSRWHQVTHDALSRLAHHLPLLSETDRALLYGNIYGFVQFSRGHHVREGVVLVCVDVMKILTIVATVFGAVL